MPYFGATANSFSISSSVGGRAVVALSISGTPTSKNIRSNPAGATEIRIFAYLQNTVLIVCFLGLGLGCLTCRRPVQMHRGLLALLALVVILAVPACRAVMAKITDLLSVLGDFLIWENAVSQGPALTLLRVTMGLALTFVLMALLWEVFVPLGRVLGRLIDDHPRTIWAYSVNVAGSLVGIWLFVAVSAWSLAPWIWLALTAAMLALFVDAGSRRFPELGLLCCLPLIGLLAGNNPGALETRWSPYQKLELVANGGRNFAFPGQVITVNNAGYQAMIDLAPESVAFLPRNAAGANTTCRRASRLALKTC